MISNMSSCGSWCKLRFDILALVNAMFENFFCDKSLVQFPEQRAQRPKMQYNLSCHASMALFLLYPFQLFSCAQVTSSACVDCSHSSPRSSPLQACPTRRTPRPSPRPLPQTRARRKGTGRRPRTGRPDSPRLLTRRRARRSWRPWRGASWRGPAPAWPWRSSWRRPSGPGAPSSAS